MYNSWEEFHLKTIFIVLFVLGAILAGTANLQLTAGVILMLVGYGEFRKLGLTLDTIDDAILEKLREKLSQ